MSKRGEMEYDDISHDPTCLEISEIKMDTRLLALKKLYEEGIRWQRLDKLESALDKLSIMQMMCSQLIFYPHGTGTAEKINNRYNGKCKRIGQVGDDEIWLVWS